MSVSYRLSVNIETINISFFCKYSKQILVIKSVTGYSTKIFAKREKQHYFFSNNHLLSNISIMNYELSIKFDSC